MNDALQAFDELSILQTGKGTVSMHAKLKGLMNSMRDGKTVVTPVIKFNDALIFATVSRESGTQFEWTVKLYKPTAELVGQGFKAACEQSPSATAINTDSVSRAFMVVFGQLGIQYTHLHIAPEDDKLVALQPAMPITGLLS